MFKELKVIKLFVFVGLLLIIILKMDFSVLLISELYTDQHSYYPSNNVKIYTNTNSWFPFKKKIKITDLSGNIVDVINVEITRQNQVSDDVLKDGLGYENFHEYKLPATIQSGIYLINGKTPLIIKSKEYSEITVVYPYMNNILFQEEDDVSILTKTPPSTSLLRTSYVDNFTKEVTTFFSDNKFEVNYVSDLDIEAVENISKSKLVVLYGKSAFWTPKMKESLMKFVVDGGNLMLATSYTMNDVCWHSESAKRIKLYNFNERERIQTWATYNQSPPEKAVGISYLNSGYSDVKSYKTANANHPLFKNIINPKINIHANIFSAPPIKWYDDLPRIDLDSIGFYNGEILAYSKAAYHEEDKGIKGIFLLQPDSLSGKIISLGTEGWCLKENLGENKQLQIITKNTVEYLLKK